MHSSITAFDILVHETLQIEGRGTVLVTDTVKGLHKGATVRSLDDNKLYTVTSVERWRDGRWTGKRCGLLVHEIVAKMLYRYESHRVASFPSGDSDAEDRLGSSTLKLFLLDFPIVGETDHGYWINAYGHRRWVSKFSKKRFAHPTPDQAYQSFRARKLRCIHIIAARLRDAERALELPQTT
jgi:hypothetical protein